MSGRGVANLVFFPFEYPALNCDPASRLLADSLRFTRTAFVTDIAMHYYLDATETPLYRASGSVSMTQSPHILMGKPEEFRLDDALNCLIMNFYDA